MPKSVYVEEAGGILEFPDSATPQQMRAYIDRTYKAPVAPTATAPAGPDESSLLGRFGYGLATGITDVPGGIASLFYPAEEAAKTGAGQFSEGARKYLQETLGIDPTKDPTAAQQAAQALGSVASFLVPGGAAAKGASLAGATLRGAARAGTLTAAAQGVGLGAESRSEKIRNQLEAGMEISPEEQLAAQRLDGLIGASEALPINKFFGPLTTLLSKVPVSKAPIVEQIVKSRLGKLVSAGVEEGAQEAASNIANDLVEYGVYNPDVQVGQDLLSNAGTGAFAGSFVEGVIQLAAGRKLRTARQLQADIAAEGQQGLAEFRQGQIAQTAEELRRYNVEGDVDIVEDEVDGITGYQVKSKAGNSFGLFYNPEDAQQAVKLYSDATGAKVRIRPKKADITPKLFPIKIGKTKFNSIDEIRAARDTAIAERESVAKIVTEPEVLASKAAELKAPPDLYRNVAFAELQKRDKFIKKLEAYLPENKPTTVEVAVGPKAPLVSEEFTAEDKRIQSSAGGGVTLQWPTYAKFLENVRAAGIPDAETSAITGIKNENDFLRLREEEISQYVEGPVQDTILRVYERGGIPYSSNAYGPGRKGVEYEDESGNKLFEPLTEEDISNFEARTGSRGAELADAVATSEVAKRESAEPIGAVDVGVVPSAEPLPAVDGEAVIGGVSTPEAEQKPAPAKPVSVAPPPPAEPRPYTPEYQAKMERVYSELMGRLASAPEGVRLNLVKLINSKSGYLVRGQVKTEKGPNGVEQIVELSIGIYSPDMSVEDMVKKMVETVNHEVIHVIRNADLFRPAEWNILSKAALNTKVPGKKYTYLDKAQAIYQPGGVPLSEAYTKEDAVIEEAVAEMYKDWVRGDKPQARQTWGLFNRITEFFRRIFRTLRSNQIDTVFGAVESGEIGRREASQELAAKESEARTPATMLSAAPAVDSEEFRRWFRNSKVVNPDGTPMVVYHGTQGFRGDRFSSDAERKNRTGNVSGFYFSSNKIRASGYTEDWRTGETPEGAAVMPGYMSLQNPFVMGKSKPNEKMREAYKEELIKSNSHLSAKSRWFDDKSAEMMSYGKPSSSALNNDGDALQRVYKAGGFDGVIDGTEYVAFDSSQVKSIFNEFREGAAKSDKFSAAPTNPDDFRRWFRNSQVVDGAGRPKIVYHHGSFTEDGNFVPRTPMHFGTMAAAKERAFGKRTDEAISGVTTYQNDEGLWHWDDGTGYTSEDAGEPGYVSEKNALKAGQSDVANRDDYSDVVVEDLGTIVPVYLSIQKAKRVPDVGGANGEWDVEIAKAKREGYDGIVYKNLYEDKGSDSYIAFEPQQVKSPDSRFSPEEQDIRLSAAPLPPYVEERNRRIFAPEKKESFVQSMFDFFSGPATQAKTLNTVYGNIEMKGGYFGTRAAVNRRMSLVDQDAYVEWLEKVANEKENRNFQRREATQSAIAALGWARRSSHLTASVVMMGAPTIEFTRPGDIQSATVAVREDADNLLSIFKVLLEPGPVDSLTGEQKDKRTVFKSYATAMRAIGLKAAGKPVPRELDDTYINTTIRFTEQNYPDIVEAYKSYQRFNKKLLTAARDAGRISNAELARFTQQMDYYGFYREIFEEQLTPGLTGKLAGEIKLREYRGSERGNLIEDPMVVIISNVDFWMGAITRNIAVTKAFKLAKDMGEARLLGASEKPNVDAGESEQVMFFRENGVLKRFAVKDPMLVASLGSDDRIDMGFAMKLLGMPTTAIRESITRDPAFMVANLIRDTLSSWITSGEDITPFIGTVDGFRQALKQTASYKALVGRGVVGSHDLAMRTPAEMASIIRRRAMPKNIINIANPEAAQNMVWSLWDKLGVWSEASDAATRIAVYEAAVKQGMSEAEAAFRAIEIMNFSRRGSSSLLGIMTKVIPFMNARIQGMDVLYQAGKAGVLTAAGYKLGERDANLGKKFLVRGALLAALSVGLEMMLADDEDYANLPDYVKNGNILIPLKWFGVEGGYFAAIAKPFEAGLLFSTIPQEMYKATTGETSGRELAKLFWSEFTSTFGVNPIPQVMLPALEATVNYDFYTDLPLVSEGKARLAPELQYDSRTSSVAMMLSGVPILYNFTTGKFEGVSPIIIDQLISGYGGPFGTYIMQGVGMLMEGADIAPERLPRDVTQLPVVKRFLLDAESRNPKSVAQAYELFRIVDETNRSFSRLRQIGDAEAIADYVEENKNVLAYKKYIYKLFDGLNKLSAQERRIEMDQTMTREEKIEAVKKLREVRATLTSNIDTINKAIGR